MAVVTFSKKLFEREIGRLDSKMQNKIAMFGTPVEEITSEEIQIEVFPNRPDLLSYHGFKRSFKAFLGKKVGLKRYVLGPPEKDYDVIIDSSVKGIRPYTACAIVRGLKLDDEKIKELVEIQEKLHLTVGRKRKKVAIGIYPLEKIKLPITFKALEPDKIKFVPLEMDRELSGLEILQRHPAGKEYASLLAGKTKFPIFIDASKQILSMPPVINSQLTGKITTKTKDVFIECSGFDMEILKTSLNILVTSMAEMGGKIYQMRLRYGIGSKKEITPDLNPKKKKISLESTNKLLGINLKEKQIKELLEKMGHDYKEGTVEIPAWRTDILHEVDLIEDVAIAYGYENFTPEIPEISTIGEEDKKETLKRKFSEILSGLGMIEVSNYHLTHKRDQMEKMNQNEKQKDFIELEESKTEFKVLRENLSHFLMKNLSENIDSEYPQKIFEIGKVFSNDNGLNEKEMLAAAVTPGNFTEAKQVLDHFSKMTGIDFSLKEAEVNGSHFISGRIAEIVFKGKVIGFIGEIHPKILKNWRIKMPVSLFEIEIEEIFEELIR
ncbi:MAG TPA: phenylalanine--tRNA ligase subunit beta [Candidatus Pacearchaeota archaeon]|nr:phenylalanine--tRNA ligase subunit beta [Candidatus Pacearchaeota archaeon]